MAFKNKRQFNENTQKWAKSICMRMVTHLFPEDIAEETLFIGNFNFPKDRHLPSIYLAAQGCFMRFWRFT